MGMITVNKYMHSVYTQVSSRQNLIGIPLYLCKQCGISGKQIAHSNSMSLKSIFDRPLSHSYSQLKRIQAKVV